VSRALVSKESSLLDLDIKSMVFGGILSLAVGGGLYGLYLKTLGLRQLLKGKLMALFKNVLPFLEVVIQSK
jgi:hypothetical protein